MIEALAGNALDGERFSAGAFTANDQEEDYDYGQGGVIDPHIQTNISLVRRERTQVIWNKFKE